MSGITDTTFAPASNVTRAMFVTVLDKMTCKLQKMALFYTYICLFEEKIVTLQAQQY